MFSLVNDLAAKIVENNFMHFAVLNGNYVLIENVLAGGCAIAFGFLADKKGRKRLALIGFALLGMAYASLSLSGDYFVAWFYVLADGIAWGAFTMLFIMTLWGDIAQEKNGEKYYLFGVLPYLISTFAGSSLGALISNSVSQGPTVFSFASFFLFAATLPLFYAPETLSDRIIKDIDLNSYVSKALEKVNKEKLKNQKNPTPTNQQNSEKENIELQIAPKDNNEDYEKAKQLAEKYY
jgi:MFS family permease